MANCVFCQIVEGHTQSDILHHDELATAFRDIRPAANTHILIIPNRHIASINDLKDGDEKEIGHLFIVARRLAEAEGIQNSGYRLILNTGPDANQTVFHIHLHLLGGKRMRYPMG